MTARAAADDPACRLCHRMRGEPILRFKRQAGVRFPGSVASQLDTRVNICLSSSWRDNTPAIAASKTRCQSGKLIAQSHGCIFRTPSSVENRMIGRQLRWLAALAALTVTLASSAFAGSWKLDIEEPRGAPTLTYAEDGKSIFSLQSRHFFMLEMKYPGKARKEGRATVVISAGERKMTIKGVFQQPDGDALDFAQQDLGYRRADPDLYSEKWKALRDRLLDLLDSGRPIMIAAGSKGYELPPINVESWRKKFGDE